MGKSIRRCTNCKEILCILKNYLYISKNKKMKINIKKLKENAVIPKYAKNSDAGLDLVATSIILETSTQITYGLGIALEIPEGFVGLVFPRSSIRNTDLTLSNSVGVIDSGYRGELQATFNKKGVNKIDGGHIYMVGDRVAQIIIIPYPPIEFVEVDELSDSERGEGGFGSTGK
jgi:dUTP pyrophosphatase